MFGIRVRHLCPAWTKKLYYLCSGGLSEESTYARDSAIQFASLDAAMAAIPALGVWAGDNLEIQVCYRPSWRIAKRGWA